jgi:hypothetical protein
MAAPERVQRDRDRASDRERERETYLGFLASTSVAGDGDLIPLLRQRRRRHHQRRARHQRQYTYVSMGGCKMTLSTPTREMGNFYIEAAQPYTCPHTHTYARTYTHIHTHPGPRDKRLVAEGILHDDEACHKGWACARAATHSSLFVHKEREVHIISPRTSSPRRRTSLRTFFFDLSPLPGRAYYSIGFAWPRDSSFGSRAERVEKEGLL